MSSRRGWLIFYRPRFCPYIVMNICNLKHVYTDLKLNYEGTRLNEITNGRHFEFRDFEFKKKN